MAVTKTLTDIWKCDINQTKTGTIFMLSLPCKTGWHNEFICVSIIQVSDVKKQETKKQTRTQLATHFVINRDSLDLLSKGFSTTINLAKESTNNKQGDRNNRKSVKITKQVALDLQASWTRKKMFLYLKSKIQRRNKGIANKAPDRLTEFNSISNASFLFLHLVLL